MRTVTRLNRTCAWRCWWLLAALLCAPASAAEKDLPGLALEGAWVVQSDDLPRDRYLFVQGARSVGDTVVIDRAVYGGVDGKGREVLNWRAQAIGEHVELSFLSPAGARHAASLALGGSSAVGTVETLRGRLHAMRMTRIDADEVASLRAAPRRAQPAPPQARDAAIVLLYVAAPECPGCVAYEGAWERGGELKKRLPALTQASYVRADLGELRTRLSVDALPYAQRASLGWLAGNDAAGRPLLRQHGAPFFAAVVGRNVVAQGHGVTALEALVLPALRTAILQQRQAARAGTP